MAVVKSYQHLIRSAYQHIKSEIPDTDNIAALQISFKSISESADSEGLVPNRLTCVVLLRLGLLRSNQNPSTIQRAAALCKKADGEITKRFTPRQVQSTPSTGNEPEISDTHTVAIGSLAFVYC